MNKTMKKLFSSVLVLVMVFGTFGIVVSADTDKPVITVTEGESSYMTAEDTPRTVKELVFNLKMPAGSAPVSATKLTLSWDPSVISPVAITSDGNYVDDDPTYYEDDVEYYWSALSYKEKVNNRDKTFNFTKAPKALANDGTRYGSQMSQYIVNTTDDGCDATSGIDFMKFYFVVNEGKEVDENTFAIEESAAEGTILKNMFPNLAANEITAISIVSGSNTYVYGCADETVADTATFGGFPYGGTVEPTTPDVSAVAFVDVTETYDGEAVEIATPDVSGIEGIASATVTYEGGAAPVNAGTYTATLTFAVTDETLYNVPAAKTATITINKKAVTFTVADATKKEGEDNPAFTGAFAEGDIVAADAEAVKVEYSVDGTVINAIVTINDNYTVTVVPGTLTITEADPTEAVLTVLEAVSELEINGKVYKDLYKVNASISDGFVGKKILNYGVKFRGMKGEEKAGGADAIITPETAIVLETGAKLDFSAAVIGVPEGVTVTATPFVTFK